MLPRNCPGITADSMPLDVVRSAFAWLVAGPHPVSVDGRLFAGFPDRRVRLDEVRDLLLRRTCPQNVRDAVWTHLVGRARTEGSTWTLACAGIALPALLNIASAGASLVYPFSPFTVIGPVVAPGASSPAASGAYAELHSAGSPTCRNIALTCTGPSVRSETFRSTNTAAGTILCFPSTIPTSTQPDVRPSTSTAVARSAFA